MTENAYTPPNTITDIFKPKETGSINFSKLEENLMETVLDHNQSKSESEPKI